MGKPDVRRLKAEIAAIVGPKNVSGRRSELERNSTDATGIRSDALLVAYPRSPGQVVELVRLAAREGIGVVPRGGGSGLCGGAVANGSLVLNMTKMNRILSIKRKSVVVEPGVILDRLDRALSRRGRMFPVRPASHDIATLGGMVSTDAGGEHVLRYGKTSDNVLGLEIVSGSGKLLRLRGRKAREFCGSEGILGLVTRAELKIVDRPKRRTMTVRTELGLDGLTKLAKKFAADKRVIACEFINPKMGAIIGQRGYFFMAEFAGAGGEMEDAKRMAKFWRIRESCNRMLRAAGWGISSDPQVPVSKIGTFLRWCEKQDVPAFGHIGHGIIHLRFRDRKGMERMYALVHRLGGRVSGEHGIGITKKEYLEPERRRRLKTLKRIYDPDNIMNRGKVI